MREANENPCQANRAAHQSSQQEILQEIAAERRQTKVRNVHGLVFTRADGKAITKDAIAATMRRVYRDHGVKNFRFHDLRHCARKQTGQSRGLASTPRC